MNSSLLIGLGAGLASAVLFLSPAAGSLLAMLLFFLVALPGFLAGLGWGARAAAVAGLTGAGVVAIAVGPVAGGVYLATIGLPITALCYWLLLARPAHEGAEAGAGGAGVEWYPLGRVVAWATIMAGCVAGLSILLLGTDVQSYREAAKAYFDAALLGQLPNIDGKPIDKAKLEPLLDLLVLVLPATSAMIWLGMILVNMWAAGRIIRASGNAIRPWPEISALSYPQAFPLGFVAALLATFAGGLVGIVATGFSGAFMLAYILMGLTVLHVVARRSPLRPFLLTVLYLSMLLIGWIALLVAMIGLGEPIFKLRQRAGQTPPPSQPGT